jgi:hypothetical protein
MGLTEQRSVGECAVSGDERIVLIGAKSPKSACQHLLPDLN